ncbi:MAG TPA: hypothetical protein VM509_05710 [Planctomycetota bacterium]|nr:hypothetical protein [Planctomycetota bacterium]
MEETQSFEAELECKIARAITLREESGVGRNYKTATRRLADAIAKRRARKLQAAALVRVAETRVLSPSGELGTEHELRVL